MGYHPSMHVRGIKSLSNIKTDLIVLQKFLSKYMLVFTLQTMMMMMFLPVLRFRGFAQTAQKSRSVQLIVNSQRKLREMNLTDLFLVLPQFSACTGHSHRTQKL